MRNLVLFSLLLFAVAIASEGVDATVETGIRDDVVGSKTDDTIAEKVNGYQPIEGEKYPFQAEVNQLMGIIINSLYSNKEIFLREVISNASDALDKIRFLSLTDREALGTGDEAKLEIRLEFDKDANTLTISDRGIGMTKADLINNLGSIAKSGTKEFVKKIAGEAADLNMIGQFGVGFYSVFLVADTVTVTSKHNDDKQYVWESTSESTFTIAEDQGEPMGRGTRIVLHLKEDAKEFMDDARLKELVHKYSEFINFPIYLRVEKRVEEEVPLDEDDGPMDKEEEGQEEQEEEEEEEEGEEGEEAEGEGEKKKKTKKRWVTVKEWERLNDNKPIWLRKPEEVEDEEYARFYKSISKDNEDPLTHIHFNAEGEVEFKSILFIPSKAPAGLFENYGTKMDNVKLYVRRVFITDNFEDLLPRYLNFVRGVVDSDDLPINVSRETLQESKTVKVIRRKLVRKAIEMIQLLAKDEEDEIKEQKEGKKEEDDQEEDEEEEESAVETYANFWDNFGTNIKLGIIEDTPNRARLSKLLRFYTSKSLERRSSLDEYVERADKSQSYVYYLAGESKEACEKSPLMEQFKKRNIEVVYMVDPVDEYLTQNLHDHDNKKLVNIAKEGVKFDDDDPEELKDREEFYAKRYRPLVQFLTKTLGSKVEKVTTSHRLAESPCVLVTGQYGWTANMERIMKAQALGDQNKQKGMTAKRILELNPFHPMIKALNDLVSKEMSEKGEVDPTTADRVLLLYDSAAIASGFSIEDASEFVSRAQRTLNVGLGLSSNPAPIADDYVKETPAPSSDSGVEEETAEVPDPEHDEL